MGRCIIELIWLSGINDNMGFSVTNTHTSINATVHRNICFVQQQCVDMLQVSRYIFVSINKSFHVCGVNSRPATYYLIWDSIASSHRNIINDHSCNTSCLFTHDGCGKQLTIQLSTNTQWTLDCAIVS